jgi:YkoY family integral membrane protein
LDLAQFFQGISPTHLGMVLQLAILEGLLSFDNALALAALVSDRLKHPLDRKHALLWGIWGAYVMRTGIVFIGVWLMEHQWIKLLAGLYLIWLAVNELFLKKKEEHLQPEHEAHEFRFPSEEGQPMVPRAGWKAVWKTILAVELMDLMFSIDSVAVALAVSKEKWVLIAGAIVGILMMRIAAGYFIKLIDKFPILVETAFVLVGIAGLKVCLEISHIEFGAWKMNLLGLHIPEGIFLPVMLSVLMGAIGLNLLYPERFNKPG